MFAFCSIIVVTTQFLSPALHKNFSEADFDFKVCVCGNEGGGGCGGGGESSAVPDSLQSNGRRSSCLRCRTD